jgi:hypothetical protein
MRVYISGKITGLPLEEAEKNFSDAEKQIIKDGHIPVNPMKIKPYDPSLTWEDYMIANLEELFKCDAIYMIDGWIESRGARIEKCIAFERDIPIYYKYL